MNIFASIPFTVFPALIYALLALPMGHDNVVAMLNGAVFAINLPSGAQWVVTWSDALLMFAATCLFIEIIKATSTRRAAIVENGLSVLCYTVCLIAFLLQPAFGTNLFFLISSMILVDFVASFIVMTVSARRDVTFSNA